MEVETLVTLELPGETANVTEWEKFLKLTPLAYCIKGERVSKSPLAIVSENSFWTYGIKRCKEDHIESQLKRVIDELYTRKHEILSLVTKLNLEIGCSTFVWKNDQNDFTTEFSTELLRKISELDMDFNLTFY